MSEVKADILEDKIVSFLTNTSLFEYSVNDFNFQTYQKVEDIRLKKEKNRVQWINIYGLQHHIFLKQIVRQNELPEFLISLLVDEDQRNKVIVLDSSVFMTLKTLHYSDAGFNTEQMFFVASPHYVCSIQEKSGDYFGHIRDRIRGNKGIIRKKKADYLLYLIIESIIDNYDRAYEKLSEKTDEFKDLSRVKPSPDFVLKIEKNKHNLFVLKKAISTLRDAINRLEKVELDEFETHYFTELKEQANFMIDEIDFDLNQLESSINLIFNLQSHRLNEVMKTLTVFSVVFIPLTFLAGIYGMNFKHIPELEYQNGYFILLGVMFVITLFSIYYFKKKKWFD